MAQSTFLICKHRGVEYVFASMLISSSSLGLEKLEAKANSSWIPIQKISSKNEFPNFPVTKKYGNSDLFLLSRLKKKLPKQSSLVRSVGLLATESSAQSVRSRFQFLQHLRQETEKSNGAKTWLEKVTP